MAFCKHAAGRFNFFVPKLYLKICYKRNVSFRDIKLDNVLVKRLNDHDIVSPTDIQIKSFDEIIKGSNGVINSQTGSGKTLAYALPIAHRIYNLRKWDIPSCQPFAIIIVPNNHLACQISEVFQLLNMKTCMASETSPLRLLHTDVVVATPSFLSTYPLSIFNAAQMVVVDEADIQIVQKVGKHGKKDPLFNLIKHLLVSENFQPISLPRDAVKQVAKTDLRSPASFLDLTVSSKSLSNHELIPPNTHRQFIFVGATMPDLSRKSKTAMPYIRSWLPDVKVIQSDNTHRLAQTLDNCYIDVLEGNKTKHFIDYVSREHGDTNDACKILVFTNTVKHADALHEKLTTIDKEVVDPDKDSSQNFSDVIADFQKKWRDNVLLLHSKITQQQRVEILEEFSNARRAIVITTDVIARGIDFLDVNVVVQYDFATNVIDVIHRAGRTARIGKKGTVLNFVTEKDKDLASSIQELDSEKKCLDTLFSRHRSLSRKKKRHRKQESLF